MQYIVIQYKAMQYKIHTCASISSIGLKSSTGVLLKKHKNVCPGIVLKITVPVNVGQSTLKSHIVVLYTAANKVSLQNLNFIF